MIDDRTIVLPPRIHPQFALTLLREIEVRVCQWRTNRAAGTPAADAFDAIDIEVGISQLRGTITDQGSRE